MKSDFPEPIKIEMGAYKNQLTRFGFISDERIVEVGRIWKVLLLLIVSDAAETRYSICELDRW